MKSRGAISLSAALPAESSSSLRTPATKCGTGLARTPPPPPAPPSVLLSSFLPFCLSGLVKRIELCTTQTTEGIHCAQSIILSPRKGELYDAFHTCRFRLSFQSVRSGSFHCYLGSSNSVSSAEVHQCRIKIRCCSLAFCPAFNKNFLAMRMKCLQIFLV